MRPVYWIYFLVARCPAMGSFVKAVLNGVITLYLYNLLLLAKLFTDAVYPALHL